MSRYTKESRSSARFAQDNGSPGLPRRGVLKAALAGMAMGLAAPLLPRLSAYAAEAGGKKILIVYFSRTGNTRAVAGQIQKRVGGDMLELKTAHSYPEEYRATTRQAKREQEEDFRPRLTADVASVQPYDVIFIGYPNWWGTMPMAFFTFLENHDFAGKTLVPFCTHGGSALGRGPLDIARLCPRSTVLDGLAVRGSEASQAQEDVDQWLRSLGLSR